MPNLVSINAPPAQKLLVYKEPACAHSNQAAMLDFATDVAPPPWRYGARIDRLELALIRYGKKSEAPYAHLCAMLTHLSQQSFRGLKITSTSPYDINAKGYQQVCRIEAKGREVASIIYVPRRSYPNMPGAVIRMNCDLLNQLGVEDDFQQLINQLLPPPGLHAFVSKIRHIELAYDVPASLKDLVMWKEG
ncbi:MAG: hypothetical protein EBQ92_00020, partial [Proteobacteria bacterium]|nr:hypothetical protein [Pseudomonadota bacterium]